MLLCGTFIPDNIRLIKSCSPSIHYPHFSHTHTHTTHHAHTHKHSSIKKQHNWKKMSVPKNVYINPKSWKGFKPISPLKYWTKYVIGYFTTLLNCWELEKRINAFFGEISSAYIRLEFILVSAQPLRRRHFLRTLNFT